MRVLKFGGTSIATGELFLHVVNILENSIKDDQVAVVLSAPAKITNHLVGMIECAIRGKNIVVKFNSTKRIFIELLQCLARLECNFNYEKLKTYVEVEFFQLKKILYAINLLEECSDSVKASIVSRGEKLSVVIMKGLLEARGHQVTLINPVEKLLAIGSYLESIVDIVESTRRLNLTQIPKKHMVLMEGFIAGNKHGEVVLLGRNGSDYSAAVLSACLHASLCEIWTDVDGIHTCDPRQVPDAYLLKYVSYQEAMELSYFGAKVLHPRTIAPIAQFHIPCLIKNINNPTGSGTLIGSSTNSNNKDCENLIKGITYLNNVAMFSVSGPGMKGMVGMAARIFASMSRTGISIILITQSSSEYSISFCVSQDEVDSARHILEDEFFLELKEGLLEPFEVMEGLAVISVVGDGMRAVRGVCANFFSALACANVNIIAIAQGSSERSISVVVSNNDVEIGVRVVHQILFSIDQIMEVFILGSGGVGSALLNQLRRQKNWLKKKHIDLRVCGIANSRSLFVDIHGVDLDNWKELLNNAKERFSLDYLIDFVKKNYLLNPVIIDCTSSQDISNQYINFFKNGFHVVTSNKKANTSSLDFYLKIRSVAVKLRRKFLYDTNVGAGLPVIENLQNLLDAGDELIKFSGILSGSLSFIFGRLDEGISLSSATKEAREMGFTEPDPREDLSGIDVARKLLILAREVGFNLELKDIQIQSVLPDTLNDIEDVEKFMMRLSEVDSRFNICVSKIRAEGKVLRFIASIESTGKCKVEMVAVDSKDPLFGIKNGENALAFYTRYYQPMPLVLRGYGAGNDVTAAGVFADLLRTLSWKVGG